MSEQTAWVIVFDDLQEHVIWAENIGDVFSFIDLNQTALFGHESIGHINIQIDKLSEREIDERFSKKEQADNLYETLSGQALEFTTEPVDLDLTVLFGPEARHITW